MHTYLIDLYSTHSHSSSRDCGVRPTDRLLENSRSSALHARCLKHACLVNNEVCLITHSSLLVMFIRHQPRHSCRRLLAAVLLALFQRVSSGSFPPSRRLVVPLTASYDLLSILLRFGVLEVNKKSCPPLILHTFAFHGRCSIHFIYQFFSRFFLLF